MKGSASNPTDMPTGLIAGKSQSYQPRQRILGGGFDMRIAADGTWYYQGSPISRPALVKLFASILRREEAGDYWLVTPVERGRVRVEDSPFTAVEVTAERRGSDQRLIFRTNLDEIVALDEAHPLRLAQGERSEDPPRLYILVRDRLEARILRPVYYHLVELGEQQGVSFGVWSSGRFFPLGALDSAL